MTKQLAKQDFFSYHSFVIYAVSRALDGFSPACMVSGEEARLVREGSFSFLLQQYKGYWQITVKAIEKNVP